MLSKYNVSIGDLTKKGLVLNSINGKKGKEGLDTKAGVEGDGFTIHAPLLEMSKVEIISLGLELGVDYSLSQSCYDPDLEGTPCEQCDACRLRIAAFEALQPITNSPDNTHT